MFWDICSGLRQELFAACLENLTAHTVSFLVFFDITLEPRVE